jgi:uncharacterized protein (DUF1778 family)
MSSRNERARLSPAAQGDRRAYQARTVCVTLSLSPEERDHLDAAAKRAGMSRSGFVESVRAAIGTG